MRLLILFFVALAQVAHAEVELSDLEKSFQKEILFLKSYQRQIKRELGDLEKSSGRRVDEARVELKKLEKQWLALQDQNEKVAQKIARVEFDEKTNIDMRDSLVNVVEQGKIYFGNEIFTKSTDLQSQLTLAFDYSLQSLNQTSRIQSNSGFFFLQDGSKVEGTIVSVGQIAKFGIVGDQASILYPVGENQFKVWKNINFQNIKKLQNNQWPEQLELFIFEDSVKGISQQSEKTLKDVVRAGGPIGFVTLVIGVLALILATLRYVLLKKADVKSKKFLVEIEAALAKGEFARAREICQHQSNAVSKVLFHVIKELKDRRDKLDDLIAEVVLRESQALDRFGSLVLIFAAIAPLLGLLGTVTGMIATFDLITEFGTGNPKLLSGGISEALVTTMFGLIVAIPSLVLGQVLNSWAGRIKGEMERAALMASNAVINHFGQRQV